MKNITHTPKVTSLTSIYVAVKTAFKSYILLAAAATADIRINKYECIVGHGEHMIPLHQSNIQRNYELSEITNRFQPFSIAFVLYLYIKCIVCSHLQSLSMSFDTTTNATTTKLVRRLLVQVVCFSCAGCGLRVVKHPHTEAFVSVQNDFSLAREYKDIIILPQLSTETIHSS
ncbi:hypothetical protein FF38_13978 [Lucilia cuprina]|uniref:Uncharacterized protein n=1 Tax=Lucilia cuprina TaxID=7375 RepID=A0A0L0CD68_LUCCU|nr:hypothetical protein FF38_13978 [Lucilia cuprina]